MITRIKLDKDIYKFITRQFPLWLYVAVYLNDAIHDQFPSDLTEEEFHKQLREKYRYNLVD